MAAVEDRLAGRHTFFKQHGFFVELICMTNDDDGLAKVTAAAAAGQTRSDPFQRLKVVRGNDSKKDGLDGSHYGLRVTHRRQVVFPTQPFLSHDSFS